MQFIVVIALVLVGVYVWARRSGLVERPEQSHRIPLVVEALAYVGAVLVLAGGSVAVGQNWDELSTAGHIAVLAAVTAAFAAVGGGLRSSTEPAFARLAVVSWVVSVLALVGTLGIVAQEWLELDERAIALFVGGLTSVYAFALWSMLRKAPQQLVLFAALNVTVIGATVFAWDDPPVWGPSLALWALGLGWAGLGWKRLMEPFWVAVPLGLFGALLAPAATASEQGWGFALGIGTAAAVMAASVMTRFVPGLPLGAAALFGYTTWAVVRYFGDTLGVPAALAMTGALVLVLAYVTEQLVRRTQQETREPSHVPRPPRPIERHVTRGGHAAS